MKMMKIRKLLPAAMAVCIASAVYAERPNIAFLLSDDQAWTDYGFMGHPDIQTPHLDKLAGEGLLFRRGYVAVPVCRPSLASMVTGLYPFENYVTANDVSDNKKMREVEDQPVRELFYKNPGFIQALTDSGYLAHQSGKWWEGSYKDGGFTHGMKLTGRHGSRESLAIGRKGIQPIKDFIDLSLEQEKPFFLWYGVYLPHTPHNPPKRLLDKYTEEGRAMDVAKYYAMCEWLDETCGELVGYLDEKGIRENTLIFYICDNGWAAKSTNCDNPNQKGWNQFAQRSKTSPYENGIRTPIFMNWPGTIEPADDPNFAHAIDIFPTFAAAAGLEALENLPGINLLDEDARNERDTIFGTVYSIHNMTVGNPDDTLQYLWAIEGDWKLLIRYQGNDTTQYAKTHRWDTAPIRLYNLKDDPHEQNEVSTQYPEVVERLEKKIEAWYLPDPSVVSRVQ